MNTVNGNNEATNKKEQYDLIKRIGKTTYQVKAHFNKTGNETMIDKIIRMLRYEVKSPKSQDFSKSDK